MLVSAIEALLSEIAKQTTLTIRAMMAEISNLRFHI
jgi:hypothetical protein